MITEEAIENLANAFCKLSTPEHKEIYTKALRAIVRIARSEQLLEMQIDLDRCNDIKRLSSFIARSTNLPR